MFILRAAMYSICVTDINGVWFESASLASLDCLRNHVVCHRWNIMLHLIHYLYWPSAQYHIVLLYTHQPLAVLHSHSLIQLPV